MEKRWIKEMCGLQIAFLKLLHKIPNLKIGAMNEYFALVDGKRDKKENCFLSKQER